MLPICEDSRHFPPSAGDIIDALATALVPWTVLGCREISAHIVPALPPPCPLVASVLPPRYPALTPRSRRHSSIPVAGACIAARDAGRERLDSCFPFYRKTKCQNYESKERHPVRVDRLQVTGPERALRGRRYRPQRPLSPSGCLPQRSIARAEMPTTRQACNKRAPADCALAIAPRINSRSGRRYRRPLLAAGSQRFF